MTSAENLEYEWRVECIEYSSAFVSDIMKWRLRAKNFRYFLEVNLIYVKYNLRLKLQHCK